jgi:UPF0755 protein
LKKFVAILSIIIVLCFGSVLILYVDMLEFAKKPANKSSTTAVFIVRPGQRLKSISENLHKMGILTHPFKFRLFAQMKRYDRRIRAGEYFLTASMTPTQILDIFTSGKVLLHRVTVPEGYTQRQIASVLEQAGLVSANEFLEAATDKGLLNAFKIEADSFEGYLFPDTYDFPKGVTSQKIISTMVKRFWSQFKSEWKKQVDKSGWSIHEVVTLASIIEKETGVAEERTIISSVFHNRLKKKMRLESDPTVIYGIKDFDGNLTRNHLKTPTPYNTYRIKGLPPGPIANPGAAAIESALFPADTGYIYFVSKGDRTHKFSKTIKEHNQAVRKYQLGN